MTSNLGSHLISERIASDFAKDEEQWERVFGSLRSELLQMLRQSIRPEFLNRVDVIVVFRPLGAADIRRVVDIQLRRLQDLVAQRSVILVATDDARDWLAKLGYDPTLGARPLKRVIQRHIVNPLSERMLAGEIIDGDTVEIGLDARGLIEFTRKIRPEVALER